MPYRALAFGSRRRYLRQVSQPEWRDRFRHLGYFHLGDKGSMLHGVDIYEILDAGPS